MDLLKVKLLLGVEPADDSQDTLLDAIADIAVTRILAYIGETELPTALEWIATELVIKRYNRLTAEGLVTEGVNGITHKWETDALDEYRPELDAYVKRNSGTGGARLVML